MNTVHAHFYELLCESIAQSRTEGRLATHFQSAKRYLHADLDHTITGIVVFMSFQSKIGSSITRVLCHCVYVCCVHKLLCVL